MRLNLKGPPMNVINLWHIKLSTFVLIFGSFDLFDLLLFKLGFKFCFHISTVKKKKALIQLTNVFEYL